MMPFNLSEPPVGAGYWVAKGAACPWVSSKRGTDPFECDLTTLKTAIYGICNSHLGRNFISNQSNQAATKGET